jgi:hypothetical protein
MAQRSKVVFQTLSFFDKQVEILYQAYRGKSGRICGLDGTGLWIIELDESDQYGRVLLALETQSFRLAASA